MPAPLLTRCTLLCSLLLPLSGVAAELYRYVDDKGVTVLSRKGVPPEFIGKGYEVLNDQGRVLRVIPPAPTPEEFDRMQADKARASSDAQLLRLYTNLDDVDRARERKLAELDSVTSVARGNLQSVRTQQANLQSQAADHERAGRQVPEHLLAQINNLKEEQQRLQRDIARYKEARTQAEAGFAADRARLAELFGEPQKKP